jgi:ankyrin repeat protein
VSVPDPLIEAIKARDVNAARKALDEAGGIAPPPGGEPPLLTAIYYRSQEIIDLLIARGVVPDLFEAAALGDAARIRSILAETPELVDAHSRDGWTALHLAAHYGRRPAMEALLHAGADARALSANPLGNTALHAALANGQVEAAAFLLESGASIDARDAHGHTALHLAAEDGNLAAIHLLLERGADPRPRNNEGRTPLDFALKQGNGQVGDLLRAAGGEG